MAWTVLLDDDVESWFLKLKQDDEESAVLVAAAIDVLRMEGPTLGTPLVKRIEHSSHHRMKELRPGSSGGTEIRILFAFDPARQAILLVAGDKSGNWKKWYDDNIKIADKRYDEHLRTLKGQS